MRYQFGNSLFLQFDRRRHIAGKMYKLNCFVGLFNKMFKKITVQSVCYCVGVEKDDDVHVNCEILARERRRATAETFSLVLRRLHYRRCQMLSSFVSSWLFSS